MIIRRSRRTGSIQPNEAYPLSKNAFRYQTFLIVRYTYLHSSDMPGVLLHTTPLGYP